MFNQFKPSNSIKINPQSGQLDLHDALKNSYSKHHNDNMNGYNLDMELSKHNHKVYYNPDHKKLVVSVAGTHNARDWGTDF